MFGYNLGVIGGRFQYSPGQGLSLLLTNYPGCITLPNFHKDFNLPETGTKEYNYIVVNIVSSFHGGTFFGALLGYPLTERFGRIPSLRFAALIYIAGSAMQVSRHTDN